jgi:hypothetical protein
MIMLLLKNCSRKPIKENTIEKIDTLFIRDTIITQGEKGKPYPVEHLVSSIDSFPYIDSNYCKQLVLQFYARNLYQDTIFSDSSGLLVIWDTVWQNELCKRKFEFKQNRETLIISKEVSQSPKYRLFVGAKCGVEGVGLNIIPAVLCEHKNTIYQLGYDFKNKTPMVGMYFKITLKRK